MNAVIPHRKVHLLVSVRDAGEARLARDAGADLIDAKDPGRGALGALPVQTVSAIVAASRGGAARTSAVAGEPADVEAFAAALGAMAGSGADLLKTALPPTWPLRRPQLHDIVASLGIPVIAVLFAEHGVDPEWVPLLADCGFAGAMIDTRTKTGNRLQDITPARVQAGFVEACRTNQLISGLAGSLALDDVEGLARLRPDYLGFRGGLCSGGTRQGPLDPGRIAEAARRLAACSFGAAA
jgi:uncharacterized protein (UPF0264 family)